MMESLFEQDPKTWTTIERGRQIIITHDHDGFSWFVYNGKVESKGHGCQNKWHALASARQACS